MHLKSRDNFPTTETSGKNLSRLTSTLSAVNFSWTDPEGLLRELTTSASFSSGGLDLVGLVTDEDDVPNSYLSSDESLQQYAAFRIAGWIDTVYVPICAGLGILGNILSLCVLLSPRMSSSSTYIYMSTLAVTDSLVQLSNIFFLVGKFPGHEVIVKGTCGLIFFLLFFSLHSNVLVMITMTAERYLAIRFPLKAMRWFTARRAKQAVAVVLLLTVLINVHHLVVRRMKWNDYLKEEICRLTGSAQQVRIYELVWPWVDGSIYCFVPFLSLVVFNVLINRHMRQSRKFRWTSTRQRVTDTTARQGDPNRQVTVMLLTVTCAFLTLVGPVAAMLLVERYLWIRTTAQEKAVYHLVRTVLNNLAYTNHAINFLLYCLSGNRFRKEFLRLFCRRSSCGKLGEHPPQRPRNNQNADKSSPFVSLTQSSTSCTIAEQAVSSLHGDTQGSFRRCDCYGHGVPLLCKTPFVGSFCHCSAS